MSCSVAGTVPAFRERFNAAAVRFIEQTGADGFRVDRVTDTSGYHFKEIRDGQPNPLQACMRYSRKHAVILFLRRVDIDVNLA